MRPTSSSRAARTARSGSCPATRRSSASSSFARLKVEAGGEVIVFAVHGGFIEVKDNRVSVLARSAEIASDIDVARARAAKEQAEQRLRERESEAMRTRLAFLWRAEARLYAAAEAGLTTE